MKIEKIKFSNGIELTEEEARALYVELDTLFGSKTHFYPLPNPTPNRYPWTFWYETTSTDYTPTRCFLPSVEGSIKPQ